MMSVSRRALVRRLQRPVVAGAGALGLALVTVAAAVASWWALACAGLVGLHLVTVLLLLARSGAGRGTGTQPPVGHADDGARLTDLQERLDLMSARLLASQERVRVDVLSALRPDVRPPAADDR